MPVTVVVGGQYGSEGKGKITYHLALKSKERVHVVRCGGPNAGHTIYPYGSPVVLRQVPCGIGVDNANLYIAAGSCINLDILFNEIARFKLTPSSLFIDPNAAIIEQSDLSTEKYLHLDDQISSTLSGTGAATARKLMRSFNFRIARDIPELVSFLTDVPNLLNKAIDSGDNVIIEGTQGFGLSIHHSGHFPYATSRDTTAASFLSDTGISPLLTNEIVLVLRTYPIRVAGNSGPLKDEISWNIVRQRSGYNSDITEYTSVTNNIRRVGEFDWGLAKKSIAINRPTQLAIHGIDYINSLDLHANAFSDLSSQSREFIFDIERKLETFVKYIFNGPAQFDIIDRNEADIHSLSYSIARDEYHVSAE